MTNRILALGAALALAGCTESGPIADVDVDVGGKADDARLGFVGYGYGPTRVIDASYERGSVDGHFAMQLITGSGEVLTYVELEPTMDFDSALEACATFGEPGRYELQREDDFLFPITMGQPFLKVEIAIDRGIAGGVKHVYPAWLQAQQGNEQLEGTDLVGQMVDGAGTGMIWSSLAQMLTDTRTSLDRIRDRAGTLSELPEEDLVRLRAFYLRAESVFSEGIAPVCVAR